jgi:4-oxalocrotonate tautomerase
MPTARIDLAKGKAVATGLHQHLNLRPQDVFISLLEVKKENWSFGNGEAQYAP